MFWNGKRVREIERRTGLPVAVEVDALIADVIDPACGRIAATVKIVKQDDALVSSVYKWDGAKATKVAELHSLRVKYGDVPTLPHRVAKLVVAIIRTAHAAH